VSRSRTRRIPYVLIAILLVAGPPLFLLEMVGTPADVLRFRPRTSWQHLDAGEVRTLLVEGGGIILWLLWLRVMAAFALEFLRLRNPRRHELPSRGGPVRRVAAVVIGGLVSLTPVVQMAPVAAQSPTTVASVSLGSTGIRLGWVETGFLSAAVVLAVTARRHARLRRTRTPAQVSPTDASVAGLLHRLRRSAATVPADSLNALWVYADSAASRHEQRPIAATLSATGEVLFWFGGPAPAPPDAFSIAGAERWSGVLGVALPRAVTQHRTLAAETSALVHLGHSTFGSVHVPLDVARALVVTGREPEAEHIRRAVGLAIQLGGDEHDVLGERPTGQGAVPALGAPMRLTQVTDRWLLQPLALEMQPVGLDEHDLLEVRALLAGAADGETILEGPRSVTEAATINDVWAAPDGEPVALDPPVREVRHEAHEPGTTPLPTRPADWSFVVRVLGPVDVLDADGCPVTFDRSKSLELLAWLTLHRRAGTREAARAALWETEVRDSSFANVVSEARRALSRRVRAPHGGEWLTRPHGERLALHEAVVSDLDLFESHCRRASSAASPEDASRELRCALELVRGAPFVGSGYGWADSEAITSNATLLVVGAAADLAERELSQRNAVDVLWATGIGLSVLPGHEELVALRLRAHALAGDAAAVRHEWQTYLRSLARDPWQNEPSDWLADLAHGLLGDRAVA